MSSIGTNRVEQIRSRANFSHFVASRVAAEPIVYREEEFNTHQDPDTEQSDEPHEEPSPPFADVAPNNSTSTHPDDQPAASEKKSKKKTKAETEQEKEEKRLERLIQFRESSEQLRRQKQKQIKVDTQLTSRDLHQLAAIGKRNKETLSTAARLASMVQQNPEFARAALHRSVGSSGNVSTLWTTTGDLLAPEQQETTPETTAPKPVDATKPPPPGLESVDPAEAAVAVDLSNKPFFEDVIGAVSSQLGIELPADATLPRLVEEIGSTSQSDSANAMAAELSHLPSWVPVGVAQPKRKFKGRRPIRPIKDDLSD